jgi:hypothetical protein
VSDGGDAALVAAQSGSTAVDAALAFAEADPDNSRERTLVWQDPVPTAAAGATMTGIEYMEAIVTGEMPPPPIAVTMRMGLVLCGRMSSTAAVARRPRRRS